MSGRWVDKGVSLGDVFKKTYLSTHLRFFQTKELRVHQYLDLRNEPIPDEGGILSYPG